MSYWLDLGTALFALAAAVFWFLSAYGKLPPMPGMYWTQVPETDPFFRAIKFSAGMNKIAAFLIGLSALCAGMTLFI
jgi:hypothetical protein